MAGLVRVDGKLVSFEQNRSAIQLNLLKSIIYKCHNKKDIRQNYLGKSLISDLLDLLEFISESS